MVLGNLFWMTMLSKVLDQMASEVPSNPNHSVFLQEKAASPYLFVHQLVKIKNKNQS